MKKKSQTGSGKKRRSTKCKRSKTDQYQIPYSRIFFALLLIFIFYVIYLDFEIRAKFDGKKWSVPARVYARPLELYVGKPLSSKQLDFELKAAGYRKVPNELKAGNFQKNGDSYRIIIRQFDFWDGHQPPRYVAAELENGFVSSVTDFRDKAEIAVVRLDPPVIGRIYPGHREDRLLVKVSEVPDLLLKALLATEDRQFYSHFGINPKAIVRAMFANIKAGAVVQGGSTLTQQLVKNFFLTKTKSLWRKFNEAIMSILLELHYDKTEILQAYLNEIYLGQDKKRAIHGFGLASQFYFDKPIYKLDLSEISTLVALVRGPSYYDPWRDKDRLLRRRNNIISLLATQEVISRHEEKRAKQKSLSVIRRSRLTSSQYPAFMDLLRRQLQQDYKAEDLSSEGLQIFSTFDPYVQNITEKVVKRKISQLDKEKNLDGLLQSAVIVTNTNNSDVIAVVGDKEPAYAGFNRALDAQRPIGSLIKPAVYLTALKQDNKFTLVTPLEDKSITLKSQDSSLWSPRNYSGDSHGIVPLYQALIKSYNQATVRLGLKLGFESIVKTIRDLGVNRAIPPYPSMLLGAVPMSPLEITQMYQTFAADGFITPLQTIRKVLTSKGEPLKHYTIKVKQGVDASAIRILNSALHEITRHGTARSLSWRLPKNLKVAGKTGTTNDTRDSWFAGYSGEHLIVVWLGTDENKSTGLTGASGALPVWASIMKQIRTRPLDLIEDDKLEYEYIEPVTGRLSDKNCASAAYLAFTKDSVPEESAACPTE